MESVPFFTDGPIAFDGLEERARQSETGAVVSFQGVVRPDRTDLGDVVALEFESADAVAEAAAQPTRAGSSRARNHTAKPTGSSKRCSRIGPRY